MRAVGFDRCLVSVWILSWLAACGGSGGGDPGPSFALSTNTIAFTTDSPALTPGGKIVTGTVTGVSSGKVYVKVAVTGPAVSNVFVDISGSTGTATVVPASASSLGPGTFASSIRVSVCLDDSTCKTGELAGSPQTISVTYQIAAPAPPDVVAPHVGISNTPAEVIVRGAGFSQALVTDVTFGGSSAVAFSRISDTEIHATHPALGAGSHAVQLLGGSGPLPFSANLVIVDPPNYVATTLAYPAAPQAVRALVYDAERGALLVAVSFASASDNRILRFQYANGAWNPPTSLTVANLRDLALSPDGAKLLALSDTSLSLLDPVTLAAGTTTVSNALIPGFEFFSHLGVANDGYVLVTTGLNGTGRVMPFLYASKTPAFFGLFDGLFWQENPASGTSANGALVVSLSREGIRTYNASSGLMSVAPAFVEGGLAPALDRSGSRMILYGLAGLTVRASVYDGSFNLIGDLTSEVVNQTTVAAAIKPDATRAYLFDRIAANVRTYNLTLGPTGGFFPLIVSSTVVNSGPSPVMRTSPDGGTLFVAGTGAIAVVPTADLEIYIPPTD